MQLPTRIKVLYALLGILMIDALIEMSFVAATVAFLHTRAGRAFEVEYSDRSFSLHGKPLHELADQGHTSNGAAGTALILVGIGGFLTFPFLQRDINNGTPSIYSRIMAGFWLTVACLSVLLTLAALIFTFVITAQHAGQEIDEFIAAGLNNRPYPNDVPYPLHSWTPENWFAAVLKLNLVHDSDRRLITTKWHAMRGWRWNLIPLFILGLVVCVVGMLVLWRRRSELAATTTTRANEKTRDLENMYRDVDTYANGPGNRADSPMVHTVPRKPLATQQNINPT